MGKEMAEKREGALTVIDYAQDARVGTEGMGAADVALPFIVILQKGSPQIDPDHADHAQYADGDYKIGQFFDTVTREAFDELTIVDAGYLSCLVEWKPRESGGGFVAQHPTTSPLLQKCKRNEKNQDVLPNGNLLVSTHYHYCLRLGDDGTFNQCVISMTSTQLKKSRRWNSLILSIKVPTDSGPITPARFASMWKLTTIAEKNDRGTWRGYNIETMGLVQDQLIYAAAREFNKLIEGGLVRVMPPRQEDAEAPAETPY